jgi:hypothetical protein
MVASLTFNPLITTVSQGTFNVTSAGLVQGTAYPDPAVHFKLASGSLASTETLTMYGGVGIYTDVPGVSGGPAGALGTVVGRASTLANLVAFSTFDQAYAMLTTPQNTVPQASSYGQVNYYRLGSGARMAVAANPALASLAGGLTTAQVSWDFVNQILIPFVPAWIQQNVTSATYTSSTGIIALTFGAAPFGASIGTGANGTYISISGLAGTGVAPLNGNWPVTGTASSGTVVSVQGPTGLGSLTITGSTGVLAAGGGALACQVLDVMTTNCQTVVPGTGIYAGGFVWNFNGSAAMILI